MTNNKDIKNSVKKFRINNASIYSEDKIVLSVGGQDFELKPEFLKILRGNYPSKKELIEELIKYVNGELE
jgi:hypothetical protein